MYEVGQEKVRKLVCGKPDGQNEVEEKIYVLVVKIMLMISFCRAEMIGQVKTWALSSF